MLCMLLTNFSSFGPIRFFSVKNLRRSGNLLFTSLHSCRSRRKRSKGLSTTSARRRYDESHCRSIRAIVPMIWNEVSYHSGTKVEAPSKFSWLTMLQRMNERHSFRAKREFTLFGKSNLASISKAILVAASTLMRSGRVPRLVQPGEFETHAQYVFERQLCFDRGFETKGFVPVFYGKRQRHGYPTWKIGTGAGMKFQRKVFDVFGSFNEQFDRRRPQVALEIPISGTESCTSSRGNLTTSFLNLFQLHSDSIDASQ